MKILIVYFSHGGTVQAVARAINTQLDTTAELTTGIIEPIRPHGYWGWLLRSFIPHYRVRIKPTITDLAPYHLVCLGFPKWTYACPPVNQYIRVMENCQARNFALFVCHRGFDEKRYLRSMVKQVSKRWALVIATLSVKQKTVLDGSYQEVLTRFCSEIKSHLCE